jgi:hypothetical protein
MRLFSSSVVSFATLGVFHFFCGGCRVSATPETTAAGAGAQDGMGARDGPGDDDDTGPNSGGRGGSATAASGGSATSSNGSKTDSSERASHAGSSTSNAPHDSGGGSANAGASPLCTDADSAGASNQGVDVGNAGASDGSLADAPPPAGSSDPLPGCSAQVVSFDEIIGGEVRSDVEVRVDGTATSQKFLLSHAHSGSCLFGAFVGAAPDAEGPRGLLVVSYGDDAPAAEACPTGTDAIPDDLRPGDVVRTVGYLGGYAPSGCSKTPSPQLMVDRACQLQRSTRGVVPEPFVLSYSDADALARGTESERVHRFAGGLVRLEHVSALPAEDGSGSVGPYGVIALRETALEIHNDLEYGDLSLDGPGDARKSLVFPYPTAFASVTGLVYLDYCTWALAPRSRCEDLVPPSDNCP